jgi:hypothetical protein
MDILDSSATTTSGRNFNYKKGVVVRKLKMLLLVKKTYNLSTREDFKFISCLVQDLW